MLQLVALPAATGADCCITFPIMQQFKLKAIWSVLRKSGEEFALHRIPRLSASLAFYTILSMGPMMLVIIFLSTVFLKRQAIDGYIYHSMSSIVGSVTALQIQEIIKNASLTGNVFAVTTGFVLLILSATSVFTEMETSINVIWDLRIKKGLGWKRMLRSKILSFSIVAGLGFLLLVMLVVNGLLDGFMVKLQQLFPNTMVVIVYIIQLLVTLFVVGSLFAFIYKVLPHAVIRWEDVFP
ncbi:MAG: YihY/virulence factor BrkB family protein, partial [Saprospiraceae bacterium]